MGFELRKKKKFVKRIQEIQEEAKAALEKAQKNIKKYVDRHREEAEEY